MSDSIVAENVKRALRGTELHIDEANAIIAMVRERTRLPHKPLITRPEYPAFGYTTGFEDAQSRYKPYYDRALKAAKQLHDIIRAHGLLNRNLASLSVNFLANLRDSLRFINIDEDGQDGGYFHYDRSAQFKDNQIT